VPYRGWKYGTALAGRASTTQSRESKGSVRPKDKNTRLKPRLYHDYETPSHAKNQGRSVIKEGETPHQGEKETERTGSRRARGDPSVFGKRILSH